MDFDEVLRRRQAQADAEAAERRRQEDARLRAEQDSLRRKQAQAEAEAAEKRRQEEAHRRAHHEAEERSRRLSEFREVMNRYLVQYQRAAESKGLSVPLTEFQSDRSTATVGRIVFHLDGSIGECARPVRIERTCSTLRVSPLSGGATLVVRSQKKFNRLVNVLNFGTTADFDKLFRISPPPPPPKERTASESTRPAGRQPRSDVSWYWRTAWAVLVVGLGTSFYTCSVDWRSGFPIGLGSVLLFLFILWIEPPPDWGD
jgi:hypothetical protein